MAAAAETSTRLDAGVRVRAADHRCVEHAGKLHVEGVARAAGDLFRAVDARHALPHHAEIGAAVPGRGLGSRGLALLRGERACEAHLEGAVGKLAAVLCRRGLRRHGAGQTRPAPGRPGRAQCRRRPAPPRRPWDRCRSGRCCPPRPGGRRPRWGAGCCCSSAWQRHHHARGAETALQRIVRHEGGLDGGELRRRWRGPRWW